MIGDFHGRVTLSVVFWFMVGCMFLGFDGYGIIGIGFLFVI